MMRVGFTTSAVGALCLVGALVVSLSPSAVALGGGGPNAGATGKPSLTVDPPTGLVDGQVVTASWTDVAPGSYVYLQECDAHPSKPSDCGQNGTSHGQPWITDGIPVDDTGKGSATYLITGGAINTKPNGDPTGSTFYCDNQHACSIIMLVDDGAGSVKQQGIAKLTFAKPATACPVNSSGQYLVGSGGSAAALLMSRWEATVCQPPLNQFVQYLPSNSVQGLDDFSKGNVAFAVSGIPMSSAQRAALIGQGRSFTYAPVVTDPVVFAYNLYDKRTQTQVRDLRLTPELLARMFNGQLTGWTEDPQVQALNPTHVFSNGVSSLPSNLQAYGRADFSAQTFTVTSWFESQAKQAWESGGPVFAQTGATTILPSTGTIGLDTGVQKLAQDVAFPSGSDKTVAGWIGYMDAATAAFYGLPTVQLQNASGQFVGSDPASVRAGMTHLITNGDGVTTRPDFGTTDPNAYPLVSVQYMVVPTSLFDSSVVHFDGVQGAILRKFLTWAVATGQGDLNAGYVPLNDDLSQTALTAAEKIPTSGTASPSDSAAPPTTSTLPPSSLASGTLSTPPYSTSTSLSPTTTDGTVVPAGGGTVGSPGPLGRTRARFVLPGLAGAGVAGLLVGPFLSWRAAKAEDDKDDGAPDRPDGPAGDGDGDDVGRGRRFRLPRRKRDGS
jgi:ABC-type phosphate transport system substrate-binding protein